MRLMPTRNPLCVNLAFKSISEETTIFSINLNEIISDPGGREDAEALILQARAGLTTWRDQLNLILEYIARDLTP